VLPALRALHKKCDGQQRLQNATKRNLIYSSTVDSEDLIACAILAAATITEKPGIFE
jgi:hypothetical protein